MVERRSQTRQPYRCEVELIGTDANPALQGVMSDLSALGCYVETQTPLEAGTRLQLLFKLRDRPFAVLGTVRYAHQSMGMGIEFLKLSPDQLEGIQRLLTRNEGKS
jgi:hypothetical protein